MDLVIEQQLENSPTEVVNDLYAKVEEEVDNKNFAPALNLLEQILQLTPNALRALSQMRYILLLEPAKLEYSKYYQLITNYKVFDHKLLQSKISTVIFKLEPNIPPLNNPLFHNLLQSVPISSIDLEQLLCNARHEGLNFLINNQLGSINLELFKAMVKQCYLNEHVWKQDSFTSQQIIALLANTNTFITQTHTLNYHHKCVILIACCYFALPEIIAFYPMIASACEVDTDLLEVYNIQVASRLYEEQLKYTIPQITPIDNNLSSQVRAQYEDYPYPRWACVELTPPMPFINFLQALATKEQIAQIEHLNKINLEKPQILIAGCGTGSQPLQIALIENTKVLAIDLSLSSMAYAIRQTQSLDIKNITYAQADLTKLDQIDQKFDYIECVGVLHHTKSIENSLRKICAAAKPYGLLRLGLYSSTARAALNHIKKFVKENNYTADLEGVRKLRQDIKERKHIKEFAWAISFTDFFSTSMCIDLLFHTHEIVSNINDIKQLLRKNNLKFIGFTFPHYLQHNELYQKTFPDDKLMTNLNNWHKLEQMHPDMFSSMYCFLAQKMN